MIRAEWGGAGRLDCVEQALRVPALGLAAAVNAVLALIWELAQIDFLTIRE